MSPVSMNEVRAVDDQMEALERYSQAPSQPRIVLHVIRVVAMIWNILKREHGWR